MNKSKMKTPNLVDENIEEIDLVNKISNLIEYNQKEIFIKVNSSLILLFGHISKEINEFLLNNKRGEYGRKIVVTVSLQLVTILTPTGLNVNSRRFQPTDIPHNTNPWGCTRRVA